MDIRAQHWDVVVIGSGFGGGVTAHELARGGKAVLILDTGRWVDRNDGDWDTRTVLIDRKYKGKTPYEAPQWAGRQVMYPNEVVGGASVFYGGASFRLREADFRRRSEFAGRGLHDGYVDWPIGYTDLEPFYSAAEHLIGVAGVAGTDPFEPPRSADYEHTPPAYGGPSRNLAAAAERLGLQPFPIPLAINYSGNGQRAKCVQCLTCDLFPCKIGAKNDVSVSILPDAIARGAVVKDRTRALNIMREGTRVVGVECVDLESGERFVVRSDVVVLGAGAIQSPRLLLRSGFGDMEPNGGLIGRYLTRHCSSVNIGLFRFHTNPDRAFHKQVGITDFYLGHPAGRHGPDGPWGMIQGLQIPPPEYIELGAPFPFNKIGAWTTQYQMYLLTIAEDIPQASNRVVLHGTRRDHLGEPIADVQSTYARRDLAGRGALNRESARILKEAGAWLRLRKPIYGFSHAAGTCRFGTDPATAVLDPMCRLFGMDNLFVIDASFMPTSGGVNPSLTIAAVALRTSAFLLDEWKAIAA